MTQVFSKFLSSSTPIPSYSLRRAENMQLSDKSSADHLHELLHFTSVVTTVIVLAPLGALQALAPRPPPPPHASAARHDCAAEGVPPSHPLASRGRSSGVSSGHPYCDTGGRTMCAP